MFWLSKAFITMWTLVPIFSMIHQQMATERGRVIYIFVTNRTFATFVLFMSQKYMIPTKKIGSIIKMLTDRILYIDVIKRINQPQLVHYTYQYAYRDFRDKPQNLHCNHPSLSIRHGDLSEQRSSSNTVYVLLSRCQVSFKQIDHWRMFI